MKVLTAHPVLALWILILLSLLNGAIAYALYEPEGDTLQVSFIDVGQGDAIVIESPEGYELLIDGGRDRSVLRGLPKVMGPFDRSIAMVLETHPDADHIGGLPDVFARYRVQYYLSPGIENDTSPTERLKDAVSREKGITTFIARRGMRIHLGEATYADVLYPDTDVSKRETNAGSVIVRVVYGDTSFLFTGDAPDEVEAHLVTLDGETLKSDVLKAGHHGSRSSTSREWLAAVDPVTVVVSAGKDNSYAHPHEEVVKRVQESGAELLSTITEGTIVFESDGVTIQRKRQRLW